MTLARQQTGRLGEQIAATYLEQSGFRIIWRNFRTRFGEIDIIAQREQAFYIVEVKTARSRMAGDPLDWVTPRKQAQLIRMAQVFLARQPTEPRIFFSVLAINLATDPPGITWLPDAFQGGE